MDVVVGQDIDELYFKGVTHLLMNHERQPSRAGDVWVAPGPVASVLKYPMRRVLFNEARNANPMFHLMEALWMLAGSEDVRFLTNFNSRMTEFSDDGVHLNGAYGYRWRHFFGYDQLLEIIARLDADPYDRRVVLSMWDPGDMLIDSKDLPCNTHCYFRVLGGRLDMLVSNRSNDIIWGLYGSNVVHFSMLQEFVARSLGLELGVMRTVSWNFHAYIGTLNKHVPVWDAARPNQLFNIRSIPIFNNREDSDDFLIDCGTLLSAYEVEDYTVQYRTAFFNYVVRPMLLFWRIRNENFRHLNSVYKDCLDNTVDWHSALIAWALRRAEKKERTDDR